MGEVDEVFRVVISAGECAIRLTEWAVREAYLMRKLVNQSAQEHGGAGAQVPEHAVERPSRARAVSPEHIPDIRDMAQRTGVHFSASEPGPDGKTVLHMSEKDEPAFAKILRTLGVFSEERPAPAAEERSSASGAGICSTEDLSSFHCMSLSGRDAAKFYRAADQAMVPYAADDPRRHLLGCLERGEVILEEFEDLVGTDAATRGASSFSHIRESAPMFVRLDESQYRVLSSHIAPDIPLTVVRDGRDMLAAFRSNDRNAVTAVVPGLRPARLVARATLRGRQRAPRRKPVTVLVPNGALARARDVMREANIVPLEPFREAARTVEVRESLASRTQRLMPARSDTPARVAELSCTVPGMEAGFCRTLLQLSDIPTREVRGSDGSVQLFVPENLAQRAQNVLSLADIRTSFDVPRRMGLDQGR